MRDVQKIVNKVIGRALLRARLITWGVVALLIAADAAVHLLL